MKKELISAAAVALLTVAGVSTAHAWLFTSKINAGDNKSYKTGRDLNQNQNSNNRTTTNRIDNRDFSDRSTKIDSRDQSDNRDMSDRRVTNTTTKTSDSHNVTDNRVNNTRNQSHNYGNGAIVINGEGYKPRVGHENASVGTVSGSSNYIDNSVSGNFGIGHTK